MDWSAIGTTVRFLGRFWTRGVCSSQPADRDTSLERSPIRSRQRRNSADGSPCNSEPLSHNRLQLGLSSRKTRRSLFRDETATLSTTSREIPRRYENRSDSHVINHKRIKIPIHYRYFEHKPYALHTGQQRRL